MIHPFVKRLKTHGIRAELPPQRFRMDPNGTMEALPYEPPIWDEHFTGSVFHARGYTTRSICKTPHSERLHGQWVWSPESKLGQVIQGNGVTIYHLYCPSCGKRTSTLPKWLSEHVLDMGFQPGRTRINEPTKYPPCSYHKCSQPGVDQHHWAPRNTFPDADLWPITPLCKRHHTLWHQTMDGYRWAAKPSFDASEVVYKFDWRCA